MRCAISSARGDESMELESIDGCGIYEEVGGRDGVERPVEIDARRVAVEHNMAVLKRAAFGLNGGGNPPSFRPSDVQL